MYPTEVQEVARTIEVSSPAFAEGNRIPTRYTGEGRDVSPPLEWRMLPPGTQELAVVCDDPDAPGDEPWVHWVVYKIPVGKERLDEGRIGDALEGINDFGKRGWNGPMPPRGHGVHHYHFKVYALDLQLDVEPGLTKAQLLDAMEGHVLAWGEVIVEFERK